MTLIEATRELSRIFAGRHAMIFVQCGVGDGIVSSINYHGISGDFDRTTTSIATLLHLAREYGQVVDVALDPAMPTDAAAERAEALRQASAQTAP